MVFRGWRSITIASGFQGSVPDHTPWQGPCGNDPSQRDTTGNRYQALKVNVLLENYLSPDGWRNRLHERQGIDSYLFLPPPVHEKKYAHKQTRTNCASSNGTVWTGMKSPSLSHHLQKKENLIKSSV